MSISIVRVFIKLREIFFTNKELAYQLAKLEKEVQKHGIEIRNLFEAIRQLIAVGDKPRKKIGFH